MFSKLLKYEFQSIGKWYLLTNLVMIIASTLLGFAVKPTIEQYSPSSDTYVRNDPYSLFLVVITLILIGLVFFSIFATLFIIVRRFYTNVYGKQGYLTLTLPVSSYQIIFSKLLAAVIWQIFNYAIIGFSIILFLTTALGLGKTLSVLPQVIEFLKLDHSDILLYLFSNLLGLFSSVLVIYLAISIGQLFSDRRGLLAFVFYLLINFVFFIIGLLIGYHQFDDNFTHTLLVGLITDIVISIISYFATNYIMTHKLNIQ